MSPFSDKPGELAVDNVRSLAPYVPGKPIEELERESASQHHQAGVERESLRRVRWLSPPKSALADTWLYPDGSGHALAEAGQNSASASTRSRWQRFERRAGAAGRGLPEAGPSCLPQYGFAVYPIAIQATGATGVMVPALPAGFEYASWATTSRHGARHQHAHPRGVHRQP
jgi:histidinol-phosphate aminotransferase